MKFSRWPSLLSFSLTILIGVLFTPAEAASPRANKVLVYPESGDSVAALKAQGIKKIRNYGSYWLVEASDDQLQALQQTHGARAVKANYLNVIELAALPLDTAAAAPAVPAHLRAAAGQNLQLIQFSGPVLPEWLSQVKATGAKVLTYIPNNAYLVRASETAQAKLQELLEPNGPVQWIGPFHPYYKISGTLSDVAGKIEARIGVVNGPDVEQILAQIRSVLLSETKAVRYQPNQAILQGELDAASIGQLAANSSVLWVERAYPHVRQGEKQVLITATFTNGAAFGPANGQEYLNWLINTKGFSLNAVEYPIVDVADSGLDIKHPNPEASNLQVWHPVFYEFPTGFQIPLTLENIAHTTWAFSDLFEFYPFSRVAYRFADDTDGHGTLVASIVGGLDYLDTEVVNQTQANLVEICNTTTSLVFTCVVDKIEVQIPCQTDPTVPSCVVTNFTCFDITNIVEVCTNVCVVTVNEPAPPWPLTVFRRDLPQFQFGLGVSPFGRLGASPGGAEPSFPGPENAILNVYLSRARISNNSWGQILVVGQNDGVYDSDSQSYDALVRDAILTGVPGTPGPSPLNQEMIIVFAGGNANGIGDVGGFGDVLVTPPATAKNTITVGATENLYTCGVIFPSDGDSAIDISFFNSFGPTADGRFKPDIVAPGSSIRGALSQAIAPHTSARGPNRNAPTPGPSGTLCSSPFVQLIEELYDCSSGTSFSAPAVTGAMQLLWWWFQKQLMMLEPSPAMAKAYAMNAARYLPTMNPLTGTLDTLPSPAQGMGMLDLERMFDNVPRVLRDQTTPRAIDTTLLATNPVSQQLYFNKTGQSYELRGQVFDATQPFRITVAWTDAPADPTSFKSLVNDLDLQVTIGGKTYKGNVFTGPDSLPSVGVFDDLNNVESVFLPAGATGEWRAVVRAMNIAGDGVPNLGTETDQDFVIVAYNSEDNLTSDKPNTATNDTCSTALNVTTFPYTFTGPLNPSLYRNTHPSPAAARGGVEAFWKIVNPTPGTSFTVDTFGSDFDTLLSVWKVTTKPQTVFVRGECGALVEILSTNDVNGTFQESLSFEADGDSTYYIVVDTRNNGAGGNLVLNIDASNPPIAVVPSALDFGDWIVGTTSTVQKVTYTNNTVVDVEITSVSIAGLDPSDFSIFADTCENSIIPPGGSCEVNVRFNPQTAGAKSAELIITDTALGGIRTVTLTGNGLPPAPIICLGLNGTLVFTNSEVGVTSADSPLSVTVTNCGTADLNITNITVTGSAFGDFVAGGTCVGAPIPPGGTCTVDVSFTPTANGVRQATVNLFSDAGSGLNSFPVRGSGFIPSPSVCLNRTSMVFSNQGVGTVSAPLSVTVTNCGTAPLVVSGVGISGPNAADFAVNGNTCSVVATGQTCQVSVTFSPTAGGLRTAQLTITNNATGSPHVVTLSGTGTLAQPDALIGKKPKAAKLIGEGIINTTGIDQTFLTKVKAKPADRLRPTRIYLAVKNTGTSPDQFRVLGPSGGAGWTVRYFLGAKSEVDVTALVTAGTFTTSTLAAGITQGDATMLRMEVSADRDQVAKGEVRSFLLTVSSVTDGTKQDAVRTMITAK